MTKLFLTFVLMLSFLGCANRGGYTSEQVEYGHVLKDNSDYKKITRNGMVYYYDKSYFNVDGSLKEKLVTDLVESTDSAGATVLVPRKKRIIETSSKAGYEITIDGYKDLIDTKITEKSKAYLID